jgi:hypothetical protein
VKSFLNYKSTLVGIHIVENNTMNMNYFLSL